MDIIKKDYLDIQNKLQKEEEGAPSNRNLQVPEGK